jgi:hypothetical protein
MAVTKYVVNVHDTKINRIFKWTLNDSEPSIMLCLNVPITKRIWNTEMAMNKMKLYNKYFLQITGFSYPSFLRNEQYGDIPHSCEAKCITFKDLRISAIERMSSDIPDHNS